jgi:hypothetical protein
MKRATSARRVGIAAFVAMMATIEPKRVGTVTIRPDRAEPTEQR